MTTRKAILLLFVAHFTGSVSGQDAASQIPATTVPPGTNPQVTAIPDSQVGTQGPIDQVFEQNYGEQYTFAPTPADQLTPVPTVASSVDDWRASTQPPTTVQMTTLGLTVAAAALL